MSGIKVVSVTAGVSPSNNLGMVRMAKKAFDAYQNRIIREREKAEKREREIQQRIAQIRSKISPRQRKTLDSSSSNNTPVISTIPVTRLPPVINPENHWEIQEQKARLPKIRSQYQALVDQQILDEQTINQTLKQVEEALNANNLEIAQTYLGTLDDARIKAIQSLEVPRREQIAYLQERFDHLKYRLPKTIINLMANKIQEFKNNWQNLTIEDLQASHQQISELEAQVERVDTATENMVLSWEKVGYGAELIGFDDGDSLIEIDTHEGAKTVTRIQFDGTQIELKAPPNELEMSCASRTVEVLKLFEEQGYYLEWENWDGDPVTQEWRNIEHVFDESEEEIESSSDTLFSRKRQQEGY